MKCWHGNKNAVTTLIVVLAIALAGMPLAAVTRGATVEVTMADGSQVKGELLAVKSDALVVHDPDSGRGWNIYLPLVAQVRIIRESKFLLGMVYGIGFGLGMTKYIKEDRAGLFYGLNSACRVLAAGLICGFAGSAAGRDKNISMTVSSIAIARQSLERLKRYAREQDVP